MFDRAINFILVDLVAGAIMEALVEAVIEFIKVRQLNFAVAALLTIGYLVYQYWGVLFREKPEELEDCPHSMHRLGRSRSRSCSRSRTRANYHEKMDKHSRRRAYGRCPDCSKCNLEGQAK